MPRKHDMADNNLDGGASCGMYYNGTYLARPGRELTVTLQVFPK